jgi:phospholipid/cholesterol/gamma-HCH transport system permease protein
MSAPTGGAGSHPSRPSIGRSSAPGSPDGEGERKSLPRPSIVINRPKPPGFFEAQWARFVRLIDAIGVLGILSARVFRSFFRRPFEGKAIVYQLEALGVASVGIASVTAVFIGMVMAIQFAFGLQKFGGLEYVGRVVGLSFARELAPTLTAVIVGGRIGAGMAAEVGSMNVTEQVDAISALGADPVKKLVMPRVVASIITMPILSFFALGLGFTGAMVVISSQFGISMNFFFRSALESTNMKDLMAGMCKTPIFGFIIAIIGCHFGLQTRGGTEGVGRSTTSTVVAVSITILIADFFLTKLYMTIF